MTKIAALTAVTSLLLAGLPDAYAQEEAWSDRLSFSGDFRLRYEGIDEEGEDERNRMRFRGRLGLSASVYEDVTVVLRFATGGNNPVSANQTFDEGFSTKDIGVDRAYVQWQATEELTVFGGKMKNPLFRAGGAQLIWDNDLNPEGLAASFDSGAFFGNAGVFWPEERSSADDSLLYAAQAGTRFDAGAGELTVGVGYLGYTEAAGNAPFFDGDPGGNSVDANGDYLFDYRNVELFAQYDMRVGDWPLSAYAHVTENDEASRENFAYALGLTVGAVEDEGTSQFDWRYQDVEADAVVATFNDSNFGGGGTDASGHILSAEYMLRDRISLGATLFLNDVDDFQGTEHDYRRIQIDVEFSFD